MIDANIFRPWVNTDGSGGGAADDELGKFGPIAIYVGGSGEVHFRDVSYRDLSLKRFVKEELSANYRMLRLTPFYYSFASGAADFDRDGNMDIVSGPFIFLGPDFTKVREFYMALSTNPSTNFSSNWLEFAGDFTGDGWPDVLLASTSGTRLYVNPKGEPRRWDSFAGVVPPAPNVSEVSVMKDVDADGKPDLVYASAGAVRWAKPDPANPTGPWLSTQVGEPGTYAAHGIGAGDINGDGRVDILNVYGWWEQPAKATTEMWPYHPEAFGRQNGRGAPGGAEMCVYDVNGDGLNDVVTSLQAHVFGLAWFEQKRDAGGKISFVQHMISDNFATKNAGGVVFSEPHGSTMRRHERRRHSRLRHRQTVLLAQRELRRSRSLRSAGAVRLPDGSQQAGARRRGVRARARAQPVRRRLAGARCGSQQRRRDGSRDVGRAGCVRVSWPAAYEEVGDLALEDPAIVCPTMLHGIVSS